MPPKAVRGAGRGRGRGRGKAPASSLEEQPSISLSGTQGDVDNQSAMASSSSLGLPIPKSTTPQSEFLDADPSPNSSPATVWTETPAPTPIRPPSTRKTESSSRIVPPTRGGIASRGSEVKAMGSRFKPKNIRRDAKELEDLQKKEKIRLDAIAAEEAKKAARAARGRGWGMRGRGDAMGRGGGRARIATASGTFGVVPEGLQKNPEFFASKAGPSGTSGLSRSGGSGPSGQGIVKAEGAHFSRGDYTSTGRTGNRDSIPDPQYPYDDIDAPRVDIELINVISDDSDDDPVITGVRKVPTGRGKSTSRGGLKPVRLHRQEHKERVTLVNTEPSIKIQSDSEDESPVIDELQSSRAPVKGKEFKGTYQDVEDTSIKAEPDTAEHGMPMALPIHGTPPPLESQIPIKEGTHSPEYKRKTKDLVISSAIDLDGQEDDAAVSGQKHRKERRNSKKKDVKPVIQTEEDRAEYERHMEDVAILANELGGLQGNLGAPPREANGDVAMEDVEVRDKKEGRLYLFQFPPVLPELYNPINGKPKTKAEIKAEKNAGKATKADEDIQMSGTSAKAKGKMKEKADLTGDATVKVEEEVELGPDGKPRKEEDKRRREEVVHEEGWIGKLVVRESGKVELCWGGTNLVVGRGVDAGFLTTGVMVDIIEKGPPGGGPPEGKALSMGQIMGKFVVTPDWEKMV